MARIVIVGSGVVGAATGRGFLRHGHDVAFVDADPGRVGELRAEGLDASGTVHLGAADAFVFLTLPTPHADRGYDLSSLVAGTRAVGEALRDSGGFHTVVVRSTVPPGTCAEVVAPALEESSGLEAGSGFALASAPEFLRAASALEDFLTPHMTVVASSSRRTQERVAALLLPFGGEMRVFDDPATAEMVKCTHNVFNAAKISFWNDVWRACQELGLDAGEVAGTVARSAEASYNPRYGISGGRPYGGACLPKDVAGFLGLADSLGLRLPMVEATHLANEAVRNPAGSGMIDLSSRAALEEPVS